MLSTFCRAICSKEQDHMTSQYCDADDLRSTFKSLKDSKHEYDSCIYERKNADGTKIKSGLYDELIDTPKVMDAFINATCGLGTAKSMDEDMKRDWLDQFTADDVLMLWNSGWM